MSSSDEGAAGSDDEQRMAFTGDNDYEDGRWIGGEFFARGEKRGRNQTREERLYGVFADGDDDDDAKFRQRKQSRKAGGSGSGSGRRGADLTRPLNFVSSSSDKQEPAEQQQQQPESDDMEESDAEQEEDDSSEVTDRNNASFRALLEKAEVVSAPAASRPASEKPGSRVAQEASAGSNSQSAAAAAAPTAVKAAATRTNADFRAFLMKGLQAAADSNATSSSAAAAADAEVPASADGSGRYTAVADEAAHAGLGSAPAAVTEPAGTDTKLPTAAAAAAAPQQKAAVAPPAPRPAKLDAKFGDWEKHTKGFGLKMMKKMGFTGRLGKDETGVTRQLEVKVRPNGIGLGFGNFREAATLAVNREIEADRQGKTVEELEIELGIEPSAKSAKKGKGAGELRRAEAEAAANAGLWRKGTAARKQKRRYITAEEALTAAERADATTIDGENSSSNSQSQSAAAAAAAKAQVIIDLRGPTPQLLAGADEISSRSKRDAPEGVPLGQELLHNVHMIVGLAEAELYSVQRQSKAAAERCAALQRDAAAAKSRADAGAQRLQRLEQISGLLQKVSDTVTAAPETVTPTAILRAFSTMKRAFPEEYAVFGLAQLAPTLSAPIIARALKQWSPLQEPQKAAAVLAQWRPVLTAEEEENGQLALENGNGSSTQSNEAYDRLVSIHVLPPVQRALISTWQVHDSASTAAAVALVTSLLPVLSPAAMQDLVQQSVLPKLSRGIAQWSPRDDGIALHTWLLTWCTLKLLKPHMADLYPEVRRKMAAALKHWNPLSDPDSTAVTADNGSVATSSSSSSSSSSGSSVYEAMAAWSGVFDARSMEALISSSIAPALAAMLRDHFTVNPAAQDPAPFMCVLKWSNLLPHMYIAALLQGEFFPKWRMALHQWLCSGSADLGEVARWYQGWKSLFPPALVTDAAIAQEFTAALTAMDHVLKGLPPPPPPAVTSVTYATVLAARRAEAAAVRDREARAALALQSAAAVTGSSSSSSGTRTHTGDVGVSFRDVVESFAAQHGIEFVPKPGRMRLGRQVFAFGGVSVYLDQSVAYVETASSSSSSSSDQWMPVSLQDLLQYVRNKAKAAGAK